MLLGTLRAPRCWSLTHQCRSAAGHLGLGQPLPCWVPWPPPPAATASAPLVCVHPVWPPGGAPESSAHCSLLKVQLRRPSLAAGRALRARTASAPPDTSSVSPQCDHAEKGLGPPPPQSICPPGSPSPGNMLSPATPQSPPVPPPLQCTRFPGRTADPVPLLLQVQSARPPLGVQAPLVGAG